MYVENKREMSEESEELSSDSSTSSPNLELENVAKHPLQNKWTLWYYGKSTDNDSSDWKGNLKQVRMKNKPKEILNIEKK